MRLAVAHAAEQRAAADALRGEAAEAAASGNDLRIMVTLEVAVPTGNISVNTGVAWTNLSMSVSGDHQCAAVGSQDLEITTRQACRLQGDF